MGKLLHENETFQIIGACFEVYNAMGAGFTESIYEECLALELSARNISFRQQPRLSLNYKDILLTHRFQPDFLCFDMILLEIKAASKLVDEHRSQILNYLHAVRLPVGLLVNFGASPKLEYERFCISAQLNPSLPSALSAGLDPL
jgi:GxxExxY protein